MADQQIQDVKDKIDMVELVNNYVPLKRAGTNFRGLCPFHNEKSPSFMVHPERQLYKCFGCNESGDAIAFVQKIEGLTFPEALELLADRVGIKLERTRDSVQYQKEKDEKSALYRLNLATAKFFHHLLMKHPSAETARAYLTERKVEQVSWEQFLIGFAPNAPALGTWLLKHGFTSAELKLAGSPERFRNRIMFPIRDALGNVVGFTGRSLPGDDRGPKYYNTPETPLFRKGKAVYGLHEGKDSIRRQELAILVEGQLDVVLSHQHGVTITVACSGTALTADHLRVLRRYTPKILLAFDADSAGQAAAKKAMAMAQEADLATNIVTYPEGMKDAGEVIAHDPAVWQECIAHTTPSFQWLIGVTIAAHGQDGKLDGFGKKQVAKEVLPYVARVSDPVEQAHYLAELGRALAVNERTLADALRRNKQQHQPQAQQAQTPQVPKRRTLAEQLVSLLILHPTHLDAVPTHDLANDPAAATLFKPLSEWYNQLPDKATARSSLFLEWLKPQLDGTARNNLDLLLAEAEQLEGDADPFAVIRDMAERIGADRREDMKQSIAQQIASAEATGNREQVKELLKTLQVSLGKE